MKPQRDSEGNQASSRRLVRGSGGKRGRGWWAWLRCAWREVLGGRGQSGCWQRARQVVAARLGFIHKCWPVTKARLWGSVCRRIIVFINYLAWACVLPLLLLLHTRWHWREGVVVILCRNIQVGPCVFTGSYWLRWWYVQLCVCVM